MVARDLRHRLAGGEPAIDLRALKMLACVACSHARITNSRVLLISKGQVKVCG